MTDQEVLAMPFDVDRHKQQFTNYLEVVIDEKGVVHYAAPSHQEKLIAMARERFRWTRDELDDACPPEYYFDFMTWLLKLTGAVSVWNDFHLGSPNNAQFASLKKLKAAGLYRGTY